MLKAELGDILYYVIFAVVIIAGFLEKMAKAKRQQQAGAPRPPQPDGFEEVEEQSSPPRQAPPKTLEEMMQRMLDSVETPEQKNVYSEETQSLEVIPEEVRSLEYIPLSGRYYHHPEEQRIREQSANEAFSPVLEEEENEAPEFHKYEFDIRQAVISSEILNKKY